MYGAGLAAEVGAMAVCVYTDGVGCAAAQGSAAAIIAATSARVSGESWAQTAEAGGLAFTKGFFLSTGGMEVSSAISGIAGTGPVAGAISGAAINIISTEVSGGSLGWGNILFAAAQGGCGRRRGCQQQRESTIGGG